MRECYKCGSLENLSIKSQRKSTGYKLMICRGCRNQRHQEYQEVRHMPHNPFSDKEFRDDWRAKYKEAEARILANHYVVGGVK